MGRNKSGDNLRWDTYFIKKGTIRDSDNVQNFGSKKYPLRVELLDLNENIIIHDFRANKKNIAFNSD